MLHHTRVITVLVACLAASPLAAQRPQQDRFVPSVSQSNNAPTGVVPRQSVGPTVESGIVGVRTQSDSSPLGAPVAQEGVGRNPAMMIVGVAALVVGAVIGGKSGTIVMVSGAGIGLLGLWYFLR